MGRADADQHLSGPVKFLWISEMLSNQEPMASPRRLVRRPATTPAQVSSASSPPSCRREWPQPAFYCSPRHSEFGNQALGMTSKTIDEDNLSPTCRMASI
jgi:hypothetical protein